MYYHLVWLLVFFLSQSSHEILLPSEVKNSPSVTACLIAIGVSLSNSKISVLYSSEYEDLTSKILAHLEVPVVINAAERVNHEKMDIVFANNLVMIFGRYNINRVLDESQWNSKTRFLLLYENEKQMENEFSSFWDYRIFNVFGVLNKGQRLFFYSYLPYVNGTCRMGKPFLIDECFNGLFLHNSFWFHEPETSRNLNGCPINITVANIKPNIIFNGKCGINTEFRIEGFEGNLINELSKKMNFQTVYRCSPQGIGWLKPSPGGAVGSVLKGESEFAIGVLGPALERFYFLDLSNQYNMDECLIFGVPKGSGAYRTTVFDFLVFEFDWWTWVLVTMMFQVFFLLLCLSSVYLKEKWLNKETDVLMELYSSLMGLPVKSPQHLSQRVFLILWIVFTLIMTVAYKSAMGSKLTVPGKDPDINTFEELVESKLELTGPKSMYRFLWFNDREDPVILKMIQRFKVKDFDTSTAVRLIAKERKIAYLRHRSTFWYNALINPDLTGQVHVIKKCLVSYHPSVATRKNSFFTGNLNKMIRVLEESGIMDFWRSKYIYKSYSTAQPFVQLTVDRFYGLFVITGFCYTLAIFCFVLEIWLGFHRQRSH